MRKLAPFDRPAQSAPTLVVARTIHTADAHDAVADAMLLDDGRILAVGTVADCEAAARDAGLAPERLDLGDAVVVPGFVDAHAHPLMFGQMMTWVDCGPERAGSIPEIVALLRTAAEGMPVGRPVRGYGYELGSSSTRWRPTARCTS